MKNKIKKKLRTCSITCLLIYIVEYCLWHSMREVGYVLIILLKSKFQYKNFNCILLQRYQKLHQGKKCIIVGNGPSVTCEDLDLIAKSGIDSFGANRIVDIFSSTEWKPKYICVMDPSFLIGSSNTMIPSEYIAKLDFNEIEGVFLTHRLRKYIRGTNSNKTNIAYIFCPPAKLFSKRLMPFSSDITKYISDLGSVTHFSIQLACYMGYETIYLYGMDNSFVKYLNNDGCFIVDKFNDSHMKGIARNIDDETISYIPRNKYEAFKAGGFADKRKNDIGYHECLRYAEKHNIKIINITHGGKLDIFEREKFNIKLFE